MIKVNQEMIDWLRDIGDGRLDGHRECNGNGICFPFRLRFDVGLRHLILFNEWKHFSGDVTYPVPAPNSFHIDCDKDFRAERVFHRFRRMRLLWGNSEYGILRREFATWCSEELRRRFKSENDYDNRVKLDANYDSRINYRL